MQSLSYWESIWESFVYIRETITIRRLLIVAILINISAAAFAPVYIIYVVDTVGLSPSAFSIVTTAPAVGGVLGVFFTERTLTTTPRLIRLTVAVFLLSLSTGILLLLPNFFGLYLPCIVASICILTCNTMHFSLRQLIIPADMLVRIQAMLRSIGTVLLPAGALIGGAVAEFASTRALYIGIAVYQFSLFAALVFWSYGVYHNPKTDEILW